jgi:hypothetical protein
VTVPESYQPHRSPELYQQYGPVAPHHRPPAVEYRDGVPYHYTVGQPQPIVVQLPEQSGLSPAQRELMLNVVLLLVVAVVLCGCIAGVVVIAGGTLMGIIGAVSAAALPITFGVVGSLVAAGWFVSKLKALNEAPADSGKALKKK